MKYLVFWTVINSFFVSTGVDTDSYGRYIKNDERLEFKLVTEERQLTKLFDSLDLAQQFVSNYNQVKSMYNTNDVCNSFMIDSVKVDSTVKSIRDVLGEYKKVKQREKSNANREESWRNWTRSKESL